MSEAQPVKGARKPRNWREIALRPDPYDPLRLDNLGRSIEMRMLEMEPEPLTDVPLMIGAGIYAIYYVGDHELYWPIAEPYCQTPIYVGKATPEGGRKGGGAGNPDDEDALWDRLREHRRSLEQAHDLDVADFRVRYLVAVDFFVSLAEQVMLRQFRPYGTLSLMASAIMRRVAVGPTRRGRHGTTSTQAAHGPRQRKCRSPASTQPWNPRSVSSITGSSWVFFPKTPLFPRGNRDQSGYNYGAGTPDIHG